MHVQLVTFRLAGLAPEQYAAHCEQVAPAFAAMPGLRSKLWLADADTGTYGGLYTWDDRASLDGYLAGPVFAQVRDRPDLESVTSRTFGILEGPTRLTRGLPAG